MNNHSIYTFNFAELYKLYLTKIEKKGRSSDELNEVICWLSGFSKVELAQKIGDSCEVQEFIKSSPSPNPNRTLITGSVCGVKISEIQEPLMKEIRYYDKLVDELAKGKPIEKICRK